MITMREATEAEMILEFAKAECDGHPLVTNADLEDADQNRQRERLLDGRGYSSRCALFMDFPRDVTWRLATLSIADFEALQYLNCTPWKKLAASLRVTDGAASVVAETFQPCFKDRAAKINAIAQSLRGGVDLTALILVEAGDGRIIVAEGNHRATAFVVADIDRPILAMIGTSAGMAPWANRCWR
jgi:hypothetical protein